MSQTEDAEDCELQVEQNENTGDPVKDDEHLIEGVLYSNTPELTDPAILAVREIPKFQYTKDELISLRQVPLSKKKPDFINTDIVPPTIWDPEHWNERKKSTTPTDSRGGDQPQDNRRRPGDPRERLRKENDGIVLSPQRRSFNSGCFVPMREQPQARAGAGGPRPHSPIGSGGGGKGDNPHINVREIQTGGSRRIGSGRILRDAWDFNDKTEGGENDYYRGGQEDRRPFRRDFDLSRENNKDRRNNGGRFGRRISGCEKDEEPEWFSGGPMSQNDTIELRGFDEPEKIGNNAANGRKKLMSSQAKRVREWAKKKTDIAEEKPGEEQDDGAPKQQAESGKGGTATPTPQDGGAGKGTAAVRVDVDQQQNDNDKENRQVLTNNGGMEIINENSFLFDDIFKCDSIPGLLTNGVEGSADNNTKSRFSRWFKQESPEKPSDSRRSSLQEEHLLKNLLNDINEPATVAIPPQLGNSESYFAPISPAAVNSGGGGEPGAPRPGQVNIAEMFQRGKRDQNAAAVKGAQQADVLGNIKTQFPGKVMSLNELESRMRKGADISGGHAQSKAAQIKKEDDMSAFKRLLAQVSGGHAVTANNGASHQKMPPMSLMEMLSHSQQQEEVQARLGHLVGGPGSPKPPPAMSAPHNEFLLKMQQAQQEQQAQIQRQQQINMLNKLMGLHAPHLRASPLQDLAQQQSKELLSRPEAQAILQGLKRGDITPQHLYQQLANPALQPRHREMLYAILKMQRVGPSPRVLSPVPPPHHMYPQQQQQQLRVSPLPNAMHQRIPSPRELQVHTQNILQRALIKKKLEEQQENFRKKQEMQQPGHSPNNGPSNKSVSSPTPLAFTPTSVLRKMTADKEDGNKDSKSMEPNKFPQGRAVIGARIQQQQANQWNNQYLAKQPGRPIVKANSTYQNTGPEQFFNAHQQQQQFMFNQQQSRQQQVGQQQHMTSGQQPVGSVPYSSQQKQPQHNAGVPSLGNIGQYSNQSNQQPQQFPQLTQHQLRAQHQQQARPVTGGNQSAQQQQQAPPPQPPKSQNFPQQNTAWQQFLNAAAQQTNRSQTGRSGAGDGDLSPTTSNQLARWFSSDLLERARGGELPSTAGLAQHAVSLEEIERQAAPPVHN